MADTVWKLGLAYGFYAAAALFSLGFYWRYRKGIARIYDNKRLTLLTIAVFVFFGAFIDYAIKSPSDDVTGALLVVLLFIVPLLFQNWFHVFVFAPEPEMLHHKVKKKLVGAAGAVGGAAVDGTKKVGSAGGNLLLGTANLLLSPLRLIGIVEQST